MMRWLSPLLIAIVVVVCEGACPSSLATHSLVGKEGRFSELEHDVKGILRVLSDCTVRLDQFHYDGKGPDAYLVGLKNGDWATSVKLGPRLSASAQGGSLDGIIPATLSLDSFDKIAIYCFAADAEFGGVELSKLASPAVPAPPPARDFSSCAVLEQGKINLLWKYESGTGGSTLSLTIKHNAPVTEWVGVGFPLTGSTGSTMIGSEVAIIHYNAVSGRPGVVPYHLSSKSQCDYTDTGKQGVCPSGRASAFVLTGATVAEGVTTVTLDAALSPTSTVTVDALKETYITWASGPILDTFGDGTPVVGYHQASRASGTKVRFGDAALGACSTDITARPKSDASSGSGAGTGASGKVPVDTLSLADGSTAKVTIGENPNYPSPEGGWGVSLWINGKESPVLEITRGSTVTFEVQATAAHPVYITTSEVGGDPQATGTIAGGNGVAGEPGSPKSFDLVTDKDTPSLLYYQCATHRRLGWKINIVGQGDSSSAARGASLFTLALSVAALVVVIVL